MKSWARLEQAYKPLKVIVVEDGSIDQSLERIQSFGERVH